MATGGVADSIADDDGVESRDRCDGHVLAGGQLDRAAAQRLGQETTRDAGVAIACGGQDLACRFPGRSKISDEGKASSTASLWIDIFRGRQYGWRCCRKTFCRCFCWKC